MAKYSIDGTTLTGIADAIRTQYGDESPIAVTDMAEAILGIEGGGGGELPLEIDCGEITLTSNITSRDNPYQIAHSGGKLPIFVLWYSSNYNSFPSFSTVGGAEFSKSDGTMIGYYGIMKNYQGNLSAVSKTVVSSITDEYFGIIPYDANYPIRTNDTLKWLVIYS